MNFILSSAGVFGVMYFSGTTISLLSTQLQCSKVGVFTSALQGAYSAMLPTIVYVLARYFSWIRTPFSSTFEMFGVSPSYSETLGVGYLIMLAGWVSIVSNINQSEKAVCQADLKEMTLFKKKLMAELAAKEAAKEKNASAK
uniref:Uncharacterized protein n=1 Tax=viral metagenome TaxID=1070528 RepID=A0A6C0JYQ6_9ZZZZ